MALRHGADEVEKKDLAEGSDKSKLDAWLAENDSYLRDCLRINPEDIQAEFIRIPGDLAYWNAQYSQAIRAHLHAKLDEKLLEANLEPVVRQALRDAGAKITEAMVKAGIESHDDYVAAQRKTIEADVWKSECYGRLDAIRSKKEMLVSLGAHLRMEMAADPLIREQMRGAHGRTG